MSIDTVFLDAGGVLCHPSWPRVADALVRHGATVTSASLAAAEQKATYDIDKASVIGSTDDRARGWLYFNLVLHHAGVPQKRRPPTRRSPSCANTIATTTCGSTSRPTWRPRSRRCANAA